MVAVAKLPEPLFEPYVVETEVYRCVLDGEGKTVTVTTDLGPGAARRIAEFEARKINVSISLVYQVKGDAAKKDYIFRLRPGGCMEDDGSTKDAPSRDRYDSNTKQMVGSGCPHSRKGQPSTCSMCVAAAEKAELIRLIKEGKL